MKFAISMAVTALAFVAFLTAATPALACQDGNCNSTWVPESVVAVANNMPVLAEINGGSLSIWQQGGDLTNTAIGALAVVPADCGECPGGIRVDVVNNATVSAIINIGDATVAGPLNVVNTAIGAVALTGKK